ncbi:MAG: prepilin-type N-terminal cleavage/methylation domain-containing protein [Candidatus Ozemobacteraceae bacterium]
MKNTSRGFSFVEVAIAILVLGIAISPIFSIFSRGSVGTIQTRDEVLAYHAADELLAWAQTKSYSDADLGVGNRKSFPKLIFNQVSGGTIMTAVDSTRFERVLNVEEFSPGGSLPFVYKVLTAEVSWKTGGISRQIHMTTILYKEK